MIKIIQDKLISIALHRLILLYLKFIFSFDRAQVNFYGKSYFRIQEILILSLYIINQNPLSISLFSSFDLKYCQTSLLFQTNSLFLCYLCQ